VELQIIGLERETDLARGIDIYGLREAWGVLKNRIYSSGYTLRRGACFDELEARISNSAKPALTEHFSTKENTYTPSIAFWICVETLEGETVGRVAVRLDRLADMSLLEFWRKYWRRCYPGIDGGRAEMADVQPRFALKISGSVAYIGDLFIEEGHRKNGIGSDLVKVVQIDALDEWSPDFIYGWMTPEHVGSRLFPSYGFRCVHSHGIYWRNAPGTVGANLTFVGNSRDHLADLILEITTFRSA
jgi:GNAT superfamily N-acetyltransferase